MADGSDMTMTADSTSSGGVVAGIKSFAAGHGGAKAVIEYAGRKKGARIHLVGEDGSWEDQFVSSTDIARQACEGAGVVIDNGWERELIDQMRPSRDLWRSSRRQMAR